MEKKLKADGRRGSGIVCKLKSLNNYNAAAGGKGSENAHMAEHGGGPWQHHLLKGGGTGRRWLAHPQTGTAIFPCVCISGGMHADTGSPYLVWPSTVGRVNHGSSEERAVYFGGMTKEHALAEEDLAQAHGAVQAPRSPPHVGDLMPPPTVRGRRQATKLLDLMTIRAFHSKALRRHSLGTALGFRIRGGVLTATPAIIVFVARKVHHQWLLDEQRLPCLLEGPEGVWCEVDVLEFSHYGAPTSASREPMQNELVDRLRGGDPWIGSGSQNELVDRLRGGDPWIGSGSQVASQESYGTLGAIVRSQTGDKRLGFLTNRHVAVDLDYPNQKLFHPLPPKLGTGVLLGAVERAASFVTDDLWYGIFAGVNPESFVRADGAFVPFAEGLDYGIVTTKIKGIGEVGEVMHIDLQGPVNSVVGKKVMKVGRSSGLTHGCVMAYAVEYNDENGICFFTDFLIVGDDGQGFDLEGDSGSLILMAGATADDKPSPLGIIWGGTANRGRLKLRKGYGPENWTSGVDLSRLLKLLQLDLVTNDADVFVDLQPMDKGSDDPECRQRSCTGLDERPGRPEAAGRGVLTFPPLEFDTDGNQSFDLEDITDLNSTHPLAVEGGRLSDQASPDDVNQLRPNGRLLGEQASARYDSGRRKGHDDASLGLGLFDREAKRRR